jgi:hypothetical protein
MTVSRLVKILTFLLAALVFFFYRYDPYSIKGVTANSNCRVFPNNRARILWDESKIYEHNTRFDITEEEQHVKPPVQLRCPPM